MKIFNIYNIPLAKSLRVFLFSPTIVENTMLKSIDFLITHGFSRGFQMPSLRFYDNPPRWSSGLLNVQRQGTLRQIEKKLVQPSSSHTNLNR